MATGFKKRTMPTFLKLELGEVAQTSTQPALPEFPGGDDTIHSTIQYLGLSEHPGFHKYHVEHETIQKLRVRFENQSHNSVIVIVDFNTQALYTMRLPFSVCGHAVQREA